MRFKKYYKPVVKVDITGAELILNSCADMDALGKAWSSLNTQQQGNAVIIKLKDSLKTTFNNED